IGARRLAEEILKAGPLLQLGVQTFLRVAGQPADDLVDRGLGPPLLLRLGDVERIDGGEAHGIDALPVHRASPWSPPRPTERSGRAAARIARQPGARASRLTRSRTSWKGSSSSEGSAPLPISWAMII